MTHLFLPQNVDIKKPEGPQTADEVSTYYRQAEREKVRQQHFWSRMKLIALLCLAGILLELTIDKGCIIYNS